jgi:putative glutamine amidotransferase
MAAPLIGITMYPANELGLLTLPALYVAAIRRAGGMPVLLPAGGDGYTSDLLDRLDALVFTGGGDLDPDLYGGVRHEMLYGIDAERDAGEVAMVRDFVPRKKPSLGICRGTQVINVALGGTLIEHLPDVVKEEILHRSPPRRAVEHLVHVEPGSMLAQILEVDYFTAYSWHHQAVRDLAPGLHAVARAPDGTLEGIEMPEHPWLVAVQWHPELTAASDPIQQRLFTALVRATQHLIR